MAAGAPWTAALTARRKHSLSPSCVSAEASKLALLVQLLRPLQAAGEKVVVCSPYTKTLDLIAAAFDALGWGIARLDGTTPVDRRQPLVDGLVIEIWFKCERRLRRGLLLRRGRGITVVILIGI